LNLVEDGGCKIKETKGLFKKTPREGVGGALGRRIQDGRPGLEDGGGRGESARDDDGRGGPPLSAARELTGVSEIGPRGCGLTTQVHGDDAVAIAIASRPFARPGIDPCRDCHGRRREVLAGARGKRP
jgi:hypothetical protein